MKKAGIVGFGRVGTAMAHILEERGYEVTVNSRDLSCPKTSKGKTFPVKALADLACEVEIIFITTPDGVIEEIVERLERLDCLRVKAVFHMSGSQTSQLLHPLRQKGVAVGVLHPLQSLTTVERALANIPGSFFTYEGDRDLYAWVDRLVKSMGGSLKIIDAPEKKVYYHAGAVIVSNYLVALTKLGVSCLSLAGFSEDEAKDALVPLMKGTLANIEKQPLTKALTGPIARGDFTTVANHRKALECELPNVNEAYAAIGRVLADMGIESGSLSKEKHKELLKILSGGV